MYLSAENTYRKLFDRSLIRLFVGACRLSWYSPGECLFWAGTLRRQLRKAALRKRAAKEGIQVPPVLIYSATSQCNLKCRGCYANARKTATCELSGERIETLFREASQLGVGVIMVAGGEPLMKPGVLRLAAKQRDVIFPVFTNGLLLDGENLELFRRHRNLIPVLSVEGGRRRTDLRRGEGVYALLVRNMERLSRSNRIFGMSLTLTRENFGEVTHPIWLRSHHEMGCGIFFMVEYVPQSEGDQGLCLTSEQKATLPEKLARLRNMIPSLFVSLPGDEERFGGCLAGGRGFVHISASGDVEPCPFVPYSDMNVRERTLLEALGSPFMRKIRLSHHLLDEARGGCTLWENKRWVESQLLPDQPGFQPAETISREVLARLA